MNSMNRKFLSKKIAFHIIAFVISILIFLFATNYLVSVVNAASGCPPNKECPKGWKPVPILCKRGQCYEKNPEGGYCILCGPTQT